MQHGRGRLLVGVAAAAVAGAGCAGYRITPDGNGSGYDVYRPEPYVLVTTTTTTAKDGTSTTKFDGSLVWLPDYSARYRVKTWNHFGKADFAFSFEDGWRLESLTDKSDNTELAKTLISTAKDVAMTAFAADEAAAGAEPEYRVLLYQVAYDAKGRVIGLRQLPDATAASNPPALVKPRFEWPGLLGGLSWLLGFGDDSY